MRSSWYRMGVPVDSRSMKAANEIEQYDRQVATDTLAELTRIRRLMEHAFPGAAFIVRREDDEEQSRQLAEIMERNNRIKEIDRQREENPERFVGHEL